MKSQFGFSFFELFVAFIILFVLAAMAIPAYINYTHRLYFSENIIAATNDYKAGVQECFDTLKTLTGCSAGKNYVPAIKLTDKILSLKVNDGVIIVVPKAASGIQELDNYILTPKPVKKKIVWSASGGAVNHGFADE